MELGPASIRLRSSSSSSAPPKFRFATTRYRRMRLPPRSLPARIRTILVQQSRVTTLPLTHCQCQDTIAQAPTGGVDQPAALRCRVGHALLLDCRDGSIAQVPLDLSDHGLSLLIMESRAEHALVDGQYEKRLPRSDRA